MEMEIDGDKPIILNTCEKWVNEDGVIPISKRNRYFTLTKPLPYDMLVEAKFACAEDPPCSSKRRNQNKKFNEHWTFTKRKFFLCNLPVRTNTMDDTIFFRKRGR